MDGWLLRLSALAGTLPILWANDLLLSHINGRELQGAVASSHCVVNLVNQSSTSATFELSDLLSQTNLMMQADLYFGPITIYSTNEDHFEFFHQRNLRAFLDCLHPGVSIFIHKSFLKIFMDHVYKRITVPFVLITGGISDEATTWSNLTNVIHWFGTNCNNFPATDSHLFTCLPLGLNDVHAWGVSSLPFLHNMTHQLSFNKAKPNYRPTVKQYDILVAFSTNTHPLRATIQRYFCGTPEEKSSTPFSYKNAANVTSLCITFSLDPASFFKIMAASKFVISPHGHGLDCHRTWEALSLGAFPIVLSSTLDSLYEDLPVLIIKSWEDLNPTFLNLSYERIGGNLSYSYEKLRATHWGRAFRRFGYKTYAYSFSNFSAYVKQNLDRMHLKDGDLIKGDQKLVYAIINGTKCAINSLQVFMKHGWEFSMVKQVSELDLDDIEDGPDVI